LSHNPYLPMSIRLPSVGAHYRLWNRWENKVSRTVIEWWTQERFDMMEASSICIEKGFHLS
jgi:hypothetical protein